MIDGHGGPEIAEYCARKITRILSKSELIKVGQYYAALESLFSTLDESILRDSSEINEIRRSYGLPVLGSETSHAGCSLVLALVSQD